jgi:Family of unknown function (DUF6065)
VRLTCFVTGESRPRIRTAPIERRWMNETPDRHPYKCLPLNIANAHGWQILNPEPFVANWTGGLEKDAVHVVPVGAQRSTKTPLAAVGHFGNGILTFMIDGLFRTTPGYDLWAGGPINEFKDGIQALTGIVETDWLPFTFTMNWKFTRINKPVVFEQDEPFCTIFPVQRGLLETIEPVFDVLEQDGEIDSGYRAWSEARTRFIADLSVEGSEARKALWQKHYFRGQMHSGQVVSQHKTRVRLREFSATQILRRLRFSGKSDKPTADRSQET